MKIEEPIKGFVNYNNKSYPFLYEKNILQLFPSNEENQVQLISNLQQKLRQLASEKYNDEWIGDLKLEENIQRLYRITFSVQDFPSNDMGFISFPVKYYFVSNQKLTSDSIDAIYMSGREIDYFYPSNKAVQVDYKLDENIIESSTVTAHKLIFESLGSGDGTIN